MGLVGTSAGVSGDIRLGYAFVTFSERGKNRTDSWNNDPFDYAV